jgi:hypothetical protein
MMVDKSFPYTVTTRFNATLSQASTLFGVSSSGINAMDFSLVYNYYAMLSQDILAVPGVTRNLAYSDFVVGNTIPPNAILSTEVDAFVPSLTCEMLEANTKLRSLTTQEEVSYGLAGAQLAVSYRGSNCKDGGSIMVPMLDPWSDVCPPRQIVASRNRQFCNSNDSAYFYLLTEFIYHQSLGGNGTFLNASINVPTINAIVCSPSYSFEKVEVTYNSTDSDVSNPQVRLLGTPSTLNNISPQFPIAGLSNAFEYALLAVHNLFGDYDVGPMVPTEESLDTLFHVMALSQGHNDLEILLDVERLKDASTLTFNGIMSQYAHKYLKEATNDSIGGQASYLENRLHLRPSSLWAMLAGFAVMAGLAVGVLFLRPSMTTPRDPSAIGALASILASSDKLRDTLSTTSSVKERALRAALMGCRCTTLSVPSPEKSPDFPVVVLLPEEDRPLIDATFGWWHPLSIKVPSVIFTVALPICAMIGLAVLQKVSNNKDGICDVRDDRANEAYTHYIPALIMLLIATLFSSLDFNVSLFSPFAALLKGNSLARRSILSHLLGKLPPIVFVESVANHHWGAFFSSTAALIGSVLTIVVSGLYIIEDTNVAGSLHLRRLDDFNLTWSNSALNDSGAAVTSILIEHMNLTYPEGTYGEFALPSLDYGPWQSPGGESHQIVGGMWANIPAIRADLECEVIPRSRYSFMVDDIEAYVGATYGSVQVTVEADLPESCRSAANLGNKSTFTYNGTYDFGPPDIPSTYGGSVQDLHFSDIPSALSSEFFGQPGYQKFIKDNPPGCPSLAFIFGSFQRGVADPANNYLPGLDGGPANVTSMVCFQKMQQVMTNVTFEPDSLHTVDKQSPPVPDESSVQNLKNGDTGYFTFEYRLQYNLWYAMEIYKDGSDFTDNDALGFQLDAFYKAVTTGVDAIPPEDLVGATNEKRLLNATRHYYRKYMAQAVNANMRQGCTAGCGTLQNGLYVTASVPRLKQNVTSALTLMIMLGCMSAFGCLGFLLTKMYQVLPHNPCSIAGTMSLLAGSEMCSREIIPPGTEWVDENELEKVFGGRRYRMGWWDCGDGRRRRFGIGIDDKGAGRGRKPSEGRAPLSK